MPTDGDPERAARLQWTLDVLLGFTKRQACQQKCNRRRALQSATLLTQKREDSRKGDLRYVQQG
jgi:hypothetical protein